ncbi:MAG: Zn-ribbon domain-containing OB-fold protein [Candidatus Bilamarchaeaceae archaeon]
MKESIPLTWRRIPERYNLLGSVCETCKTNFFPPRSVCPKCRRKGKMGKTEFSGKGRVYSYTTIDVPPEGFEEQVPYAFAIIELDEGPRIAAQIVDADKGSIKIGAKVESIFRVIQKDDPDGLIHYGFKFRLVK